jgi:MFS transporter, putative metabolite:H+ symporter
MNAAVADVAASVARPPYGPVISQAGDISARLDRLPATWSVWKLVIMLSLGSFFELYDLVFTGYVTPGLVKSGVLSANSVSLSDATDIASFVTLLFSGRASFIAALFAGLFLGTIVCGFLADRFGRRAIFTYSLLWYTAANAIMAFQNEAFGLNLWRFIAGLGVGVEIVTINAYLSELVPKHLRGRAFAFSQAVGFCAFPVAAYLSYLLVPTAPFGVDGWRWVVLIGCHGALFVWWVRLALPESIRWLAQKGRVEEADRLLSTLEARVEKEAGKPLPPPAAAEPVVQRGKFSDMWVSPFRNRAIMMIIFNVFQTVGYYGFANWVPTLLIKQGITVTTSLMYTSIIAIAAPIGPILGLLIADRVERKTVIIVMALANIICGLIFSQVTDMPMIVLMGVCLTLAGNIISYTYHAYQNELFPTGIRARAVGFVYSWSRFSAIFTAFIIEYVLNHAGVTGVFIFIAVAVTIALLAIGLMGPKTKDRALEAISR